MTEFDKSVFINCPFDSSYYVLLHSMLFSIVALGYTPRIAKETTDAGVLRLNKIYELINASKYSIHDLSKIKAAKKNEYFRLNMPFELGLDYGCRKYSSDERMFEKKFLVLSGAEYEYMKALSDISGVDIQYHKNEPREMIKAIRHWFFTNAGLKNAPSPNEIWLKSIDFNAAYVLFAREKGYEAEDMYSIPLREQISMIEEFIIDNPFH